MQEVMLNIKLAEQTLEEERLTLAARLASIEQGISDEIYERQHQDKAELKELRESLLADQQTELAELKSTTQASVALATQELGERFEERKEQAVATMLKEVGKLYGHF